MDEGSVYANVGQALAHHGRNYPRAADSENIPVSEEQICAPESKKTAHTGTAVFLGLLCLLLKAGLVALIFLLTKSNSEWEMKMMQMEMNYINLTNERNSLRMHLKNLTEEKEHLQSRYDLISEKETFENWVKFDYSFYFISAEKKTWEESRQECLKKGADLVIISGEKMQKFVTSFNRRVWIGLTDKEEEGVWKWVDGERLKTGFWRAHQPDSNLGRTEEDCAEIRWYTDGTLQWNDIHCWQKNDWICEILLK